MTVCTAACFALLVLVAGPASTQGPVSLDALLEASRAAHQAGQPDRAVTLLEAAVERARADGRWRAEADVHLLLATAYTSRDQRDRAARELEQARSLFAAAGSRREEARTLVRLGETRYALGANTQAAALAREALATFSELGDRQGVIDAAEVFVYAAPEGAEKTDVRRRALAMTGAHGRPLACGVFHEWADELFNAGRQADAFTRVSEAITCFRAERLTDREGRARVSLGRVYRVHGRLGEALDQYRQALALHTLPGSTDPVGAVQAMNAIAVTLGMMGRIDEARAQYEAALARARATAPSTVPFFLANLGGFTLDEGHHAEALALLDEAIAASPDTPHLSRRLSQRAMALAGLGRTQEAAETFDRAVALANTRGPEDWMVVRRTRATFFIDQRRFAEAEADLRAITEGIEAVRTNSVPSDDMRRGFSETTQTVLGAYVDLLGTQGRAGEALAAAERARARAFLDLRAERAGDGRLATPATVADARRIAARHRSTIVAYWAGPSALSIWVVPPGAEPALVRVPVLPSRLTTLVRATAGFDTDAFASRGLLVTTRAQRTPWRELEGLLIAPIRHLLPSTAGSRLTIVPHGPLFALSFAGLLQPSGRALLETYDLHYVPAIAVLGEPAAGGREPARGALVVGDPGALPAEPGQEALPALPWARREVDAVRAALGPETAVLTAAGATESRVRASLPGRRVVHFATHGVVSNAAGRSSYLALRPSPDADGRLGADELYDLTLDADLVVLSACRTALGPVEGDGVIGLARAFLSAGARSVVATQWDVSDRVSYDVMRRFYGQRRLGLSKSQALRAAQLGVLRALRAGRIVSGAGRLPETPRLWAGFILTGEP